MRTLSIWSFARPSASPRRSLRSRLIAAALLTWGCARYDAPPEAAIVGLNDGLLPDATQPLVIQFSEPVARDTMALRVAPFITDGDGNLGDEDDDPNTTLAAAFEHDPKLEDRGGVAEWLDDRTYRITLDTTPPIGQSVVLVVEPGLADREGNVTEARQRIVFGYEFKCSGKVGSQIFQAGTYFLLIDVEAPIETQIQLFGVIGVDATSGRFLGTFTNADRNRDPDRCPTPCESTEACQLVPSPKCVVPSERAGTVDEYSDWVANLEPPTGYSFLVAGCVEDQPDDTVAFVNVPTDVVVQSPPVTVKEIVLASAFKLDDAGVLRGTGTMKSKDVLLGTSSSGAGLGNFTARTIPEADIPPNLPQPPPVETEIPDAGP